MKRSDSVDFEQMQNDWRKALSRILLFAVLSNRRLLVLLGLIALHEIKYFMSYTWIIDMFNSDSDYCSPIYIDGIALSTIIPLNQ